MKISDLQAKDVINVTDGRRLGHIHDLEIDVHRGTIRAVVIPGEGRFFGWFQGGQEWVIPWKQILKIGSDVILVRVDVRYQEAYMSLPSGDEPMSTM